MGLDAHHGNGTQDAFYSDPRVLYVSLHQWPLYPDGPSTRPATGWDWAPRSTSRCHRRRPVTLHLAAIDQLVTPVVQQFRPTWLILSAGSTAIRPTRSRTRPVGGRLDDRAQVARVRPAPGDGW
ncbi:MAG: hypothetical protein R2705_07145 [Ilumatobacteraceae bacterium]